MILDAAELSNTCNVFNTGRRRQRGKCKRWHDKMVHLKYTVFSSKCIFDITPLGVQTLPKALTGERPKAENTVHCTLNVCIRIYSYTLCSTFASILYVQHAVSCLILILKNRLLEWDYFLLLYHQECIHSCLSSLDSNFIFSFPTYSH